MTKIERSAQVAEAGLCCLIGLATGFDPLLTVISGGFPAAELALLLRRRLARVF
jgi:hypothetical protein